MSVLDRIVEAKKEEVRRLQPWRRALRSGAESAGAARDFAAALVADEAVSVIAEVKRRSPSAGWIRRDASASGLASLYAHGGASALSVLTDESHFGGSREDLETARAAVSLPVLRKDFVLDAVQVYESRAMGADAVLLIVGILEAGRLSDLVTLSEALGMAAVVEAHGAGEVDRAVESGARVIGLNNRDLSSFDTDVTVAETLAARVPEGVIVVAESGIRDPADVDRLAVAGVDAVLVGESVAGAADPEAAVRRLVGRGRR